MYDILQGFTVYIDSLDKGIVAETFTIPRPKPMTQSYGPGGSHMTVDVIHSKLEALTGNIKFSGQDSDIMRKASRGPGNLVDITARQAIQPSSNSPIIKAHVLQMRCAMILDDGDDLQNGEKVGLSVNLTQIEYYAYTIDNEVVQKLQFNPPIWICDGVDQYAQIRQALGYAA